LDPIVVLPKLSLFLCLLICFNIQAQTSVPEALPKTKEVRIITLSPHLTEIVFALGQGDNLVAVSDYSDYPKQATSIESVASYEGANIAEIVRLQGTHILVWRGGNKDADIEKISQLNIELYESNITSVSTLFDDIAGIGEFLGAQKEAAALLESMSLLVDSINSKHQHKNISAIYYLSTQPLVGLGNDKWLNSLLKLCGINNIYLNSPSAYPQLQMSHVLRKQANLLIAASSSTKRTVEAFWEPYQSIYKAKIVLANPDALHRFTPRALNEIDRVCDAVYTN
jgi:vitamin B12 transport system substrate-binding protein